VHVCMRVRVCVCVCVVRTYKLLTNEKPQHGVCPSGGDSWCKFETVPFHGLHMNIIHILYLLLLWTQLSHCSGMLLV
jgi:hypothetical protein